ncbi:MAG: SDR family oxidoreductase [Sphingopyxis sp.]|nr:SDR family oxidoreductase [Sphingopyxis sp.]
MSKHDLTGRRIAIAGGTGDVGVEIVARLLAAGAEVVAVVRTPSRAAALGTDARLTVIEGFPDDDSGVAALRVRLSGIGPIDGAVASLGPWHQGNPITDLAKADWDNMVSASLTSHYLFARAMVPALAASAGQYVMINGAAAQAPVPGAGVVSILARAQTMLGEVIAAENPGVAVHTLMLRSIIVTRARGAHDPSWITAGEVGDACAWMFTEQGRLTAGSMVQLGPKPVGRG